MDCPKEVSQRGHTILILKINLVHYTSTKSRYIGSQLKKKLLGILHLLSGETHHGNLLSAYQNLIDLRVHVSVLTIILKRRHNRDVHPSKRNMTTKVIHC